MATVIPVLGEMHQIAAPGEKSGVDRLIILGGLPDGDTYKREVWEADNGDTFVYHEPTPASFARGLKFNIRATRFISIRGGFQQVTGTVVYLSPSEWAILEAAEKATLEAAKVFQSTYLGTPHPGTPASQPLKAVPPPPEPTVPIGGKTYPVRRELQALGGRWDASIKSWIVPQSKEYEARGIVARGPLPTSPSKSSGDSHTHGYTGRGTVLDPGLKVDPTTGLRVDLNDMAARFGSGPRRNMKEGSCYKCGTPISVRGGSLLKDAKGRWVVECLPENQTACKERAFDDSLLSGPAQAPAQEPEKVKKNFDFSFLEDDDIPQDPREVALEKEDVPF